MNSPGYGTAPDESGLARGDARIRVLEAGNASLEPDSSGDAGQPGHFMPGAARSLLSNHSNQDFSFVAVIPIPAPVSQAEDGVYEYPLRSQSVDRGCDSDLQVAQMMVIPWRKRNIKAFQESFSLGDRAGENDLLTVLPWT
jgi:hypothetical protein